MKTLIMSIKPCYSQAILAGEKTVEFRRVFGDAAAQADRVIIYESSPTMRIVGSFGIARTHKDESPSAVWWEAWSNGKPGIERDTYDAYARSAICPCAIFIKDVVRYEIPIDPRQTDPRFCPPQSYMWMPESLADVCEKAEWGNMAAIAARGGAFQ